ncbi:hypothetical protein [Corynebacterium auriscanis]|uniref:hypothetical protein n=1 Tax=Corynebacterium auriscanis TaxID=99807 RepID=UPI002247C358|nr:hypothetical protein [Corynebacterium auriscanis]MCX2162443.1 hypothetical protein [Corynebacterium auriscanis]
MNTVIVALHILTAILLIGPVAVSTSAYAPTFRKAAAGDAGATGALRFIFRTTRTYGLASLIVPTLGLIAFLTSEVARENYAFHAAILIAVIAWGFLLAVVIPTQRKGLIKLGALDPSDNPASDKEAAAVQKLSTEKVPGKAAMFGGIFNLLWIITAILMFV